MLTPTRVRDAHTVAADLERAVRAQTASPMPPERQRQALAVFRHAHALRLALEAWQDTTPT